MARGLGRGEPAFAHKKRNELPAAKLTHYHRRTGRLCAVLAEGRAGGQLEWSAERQAAKPAAGLPQSLL